MATDPRPEFTPALDAARKRRIKLRDELYDVEKAISRPAPGRVESWTANVVEQLQKLRDAMDEHVYVTEEPEGLYDEVLDLSPRLAGKVRRLREEQPLYYNEKYDFFALSRFDDVEQGLKDWHTYSSAKGTLIELIKADFEMPPGSIIFEDPPPHDRHRQWWPTNSSRVSDPSCSRTPLPIDHRAARVGSRRPHMIAAFTVSG